MPRIPDVRPGSEPGGRDARSRRSRHSSSSILESEPPLTANNEAVRQWDEPARFVRGARWRYRHRDARDPRGDPLAPDMMRHPEVARHALTSAARELSPTSLRRDQRAHGLRGCLSTFRVILRNPGFSHPETMRVADRPHHVCFSDSAPSADSRTAGRSADAR